MKVLENKDLAVYALTLVFAIANSIYNWQIPYNTIAALAGAIVVGDNLKGVIAILKQHPELLKPLPDDIEAVALDVLNSLPETPANLAKG